MLVMPIVMPSTQPQPLSTPNIHILTSPHLLPLSTTCTTAIAMPYSSSSTTTAHPPLAGDSLPCDPPKKRRRTRRRRLQELPQLTPSCSSTSSASPRNYEKIDGNGDVDKTEEVMEEEEEEDTYLAYCLMLLSRGPAPSAAAGSGSAGRRRRPREVEEIGVYRCKTCNKTFSSFQALGGHRTSHTKPKLALAAPPPLTLTIAWCPDGGINTDIPSIAAIPFEAAKLRVHACSICGLEFASGQALGGHMRRHRPLSGTGSVAEKYVESEDDKAMMLLDLNAPPPPHFDYELPTKSPPPPPSGLQLSALVGCHY